MRTVHTDQSTVVSHWVTVARHNDTMWWHWHSVVVFIVRCYWLLVITVQTVVLCFVDWHHCFTSASNKEQNYFKHNVWSRQVGHIRLSTGMWILAVVNSSLHWYKVWYSLTSHWSLHLLVYITVSFEIRETTDPGRSIRALTTQYSSRLIQDQHMKDTN